MEQKKCRTIQEQKKTEKEKAHYPTKEDFMKMWEKAKSGRRIEIPLDLSKGEKRGGLHSGNTLLTHSKRRYDSKYGYYRKDQQRAEPVKREVAPTLFINADRGINEIYKSTGYFKGHRPSLDTRRTRMGLYRDMLEKSRGSTESYRRLLKQVLSHEIQHYIQEKKGGLIISGKPQSVFFCLTA